MNDGCKTLPAGHEQTWVTPADGDLAYVLNGQPVVCGPEVRWVVYVLLDPDSLEPRYVGKTRSPALRYAWHRIKGVKPSGRSPVKLWEIALKEDGKRPRMVALASVTGTDGEWAAGLLEAAFIDRFTQAGADLLNCVTPRSEAPEEKRRRNNQAPHVKKCRALRRELLAASEREQAVARQLLREIDALIASADKR